MFVPVEQGSDFNRKERKESVAALFVGAGFKPALVSHAKARSREEKSLRLAPFPKSLSPK